MYILFSQLVIWDVVVSFNNEFVRHNFFYQSMNNSIIALI